jgi:hypothetical protein
MSVSAWGGFMYFDFPHYNITLRLSDIMYFHPYVDEYGMNGTVLGLRSGATLHIANVITTVSDLEKMQSVGEQ